jgi:hypothetical protein
VFATSPLLVVKAALFITAMDPPRIAGPRRCEADEQAILAALSRCEEQSGTTTPSNEETRNLCTRRELTTLLEQCPSPLVRLTLGSIEAVQHEYLQSWNHIQQSLATHDALVEAHRTEIERDVLPNVRAHIALIEPTCTTPGAILSVNGQSVGSLPLSRPFAVLPGMVRVRVSADEHRTEEVSVSLTGGGSFRNAIALTRLTANGDEPVASPAPLRRVVGWSLVATGAAVATAGVVLTVLSSGTASELEAYCEEQSSPDRVSTCSAARTTARIPGNGPGTISVSTFCANPNNNELSTLCSRNDTQPVLAWVLGLGGLALATTGAVLVLTASRGQAAPRVSASGWIQHDGGGLSLHGSF